MTEDPPNKKLIPLGVALLTLWLTPAGMFNFQSQGNGMLGGFSEIQVIEGSYLLPQAPPFIHRGRALASMGRSHELLTYETLINCLVYYESGGNSEAVGKDGEIGILQFLPTTWRTYCVNKYGFEDNIWSEDLQKICADQMLKEDFRNIRHWTTASKCLKY